jgi:hypothetical protein
MLENNQSVKKIQQKSIFNLILFLIISLLLIGLEVFYLGPKTQVVQDLVVQPGIKVDVDASRQAFTEIKEKLLKDPAYLKLQKFGDWPKAIDQIPSGRQTPFEKP